MRRRISLLALPLLTAAFAAPSAAAAGWSIQSAPVPKGSTGSFLNADACTSGHACIAVGGYTGKSGGFPMAERWTGAKWSIQKVPAPTVSPTGSKVASSAVNDVSCTSSSDCIAVGGYRDEGGGKFTLAWRWNGNKWSILPTPHPSNVFGNQLVSVSCTSGSACTAVGDAAKNSDEVGAEPLAERWNGKRWSFQKTKNPPDPGPLSDVSCTAGGCVAVGSYIDGSGNTLTFAEGWDGKSWSMQTTQNPGLGVDDMLSGVSCSTSACTAVGQYLSNGSGVVPLAERWNGSTWSVQQMPPPKGAKGNDLFDVSCTSNACTAIGLYFDNKGNAPTLAEHWNGIKWSVQKTPNPAGYALSLFGVSCTSSSACTAVGNEQHHSANQLPLIERHS